MDPGIGSAGPVNHDPATAQAMKDCLQLPLDGAISTLALPAMETGAVKVQEQVDGASDHGRNLAVGAASYKQEIVTVGIDPLKTQAVRERPVHQGFPQARE